MYVLYVIIVCGAKEAYFGFQRKCVNIPSASNHRGFGLTTSNLLRPGNQGVLL